MRNLDKVRSIDFIAGYVYKSIEYNCATNTKAFKEIPEEGYSNEFSFPKTWIGGECYHNIHDIGFKTKMEKIVHEIFTVFDSTFNCHNKKFKLAIIWGEDPRTRSYVSIQYCLTKVIPKKMTIAEIEEKLGYRIEIISEDT